MGMDSKRLTTEQIKRLAFGIGSLSQEQRGTIRGLLERLAKDGIIWRRELTVELRKLKQAGTISDIDRRAVEAAVFEE
jgi:hypothetical protein